MNIWFPLSLRILLCSSGIISWDHIVIYVILGYYLIYVTVFLMAFIDFQSKKTFVILSKNSNLLFISGIVHTCLKVLWNDILSDWPNALSSLSQMVNCLKSKRWAFFNTDQNVQSLSLKNLNLKCAFVFDRRMARSLLCAIHHPLYLFLQCNPSI